MPAKPTCLKLLTLISNWLNGCFPERLRNGRFTPASPQIELRDSRTCSRQTTKTPIPQLISGRHIGRCNRGGISVARHSKPNRDPQRRRLRPVLALPKPDGEKPIEQRFVVYARSFGGLREFLAVADIG